MTDLLISTLIQGLVYALISFGVYITYSILDFPDLGVDGTFPLGTAVTAVMLTKGVDPWLTLPIAMLVGGLAGLFTGFIHVRLKVRNLLAGIITMTALFSINLQIAGSNLTVDRGTDTIFTSAPVMALMGNASNMTRKLVVSLVLILVVKLVLDLYLRTKSGLLLRAVGDNAGLVTSLAWKYNGQVSYVMEGNLNYTGAVITWLKDSLGLIASAGETEALARSANPADTTCLVPAFTGLGAPYWASEARALISGMTRLTGKAELVRAALDCIACQIYDVVAAMEKDTGIRVPVLRVDGGPTRNGYLMQF